MELPTDWVALIRDVGFPISVAWFVLWRLNGKVGTLTDAIVENTQAVRDLVGKVTSDNAAEEVKADLRAKNSVDTLLDAIRATTKTSA